MVCCFFQMYLLQNLHAKRSTSKIPAAGTSLPKHSKAVLQRSCHGPIHFFFPLKSHRCGYELHSLPSQHTELQQREKMSPRSHRKHSSDTPRVLSVCPSSCSALARPKLGVLLYKIKLWFSFWNFHMLKASSHTKAVEPPPAGALWRDGEWRGWRSWHPTWTPLSILCVHAEHRFSGSGGFCCTTWAGAALWRLQVSHHQHRARPAAQTRSSV